jgi:hypothetical protein
VTDIAEHIKATSDKDRLGKRGVARCVHGRDVRLRIIYPLRNQAPYELQHTGRVHVPP